MLYTDKVLSHFKNPHNQGVLEHPTVVGEAGNIKCGDIMKLYLDIKDDKVADIKFETLGCAAAIAVSSIYTDMVKGKSLAEAAQVTNKEIAEELGGLPPQKLHCSMLVAEAFKDALTKLKK
ncbi:MAG: iron-sulfur cluster assembly scaffold protein [bacterium]